MYGNSSEEFDIGHCPIKVKVKASLWNILPFTTMQSVKSFILALARDRKLLLSMCVHQTRKGFSEKPKVAFTNSTVYILDFYMYIYCYITCLVSYFGLECLNFEESSYSQLPGRLSLDYKYLCARQIPHQLSFHSQTMPDCIRGVFL